MNRRKDKKLLRQVLDEVMRNQAFGGQEIRWIYSLGISMRREHGETMESYCDRLWKYWKYNLR